MWKFVEKKPKKKNKQQMVEQNKTKQKTSSTSVINVKLNEKKIIKEINRWKKIVEISKEKKMSQRNYDDFWLGLLVCVCVWENMFTSFIHS